MDAKLKSELREKYNVVLELDRFVIVSVAKSYNVGVPFMGKQGEEDEEVKLKATTYHPNLHQALANLSQRVLKDEFKKEDYTPTLENLIKTINKHIKKFEKLTKDL